MKRTRKSGRLGKLLFFIPVVAIFALVVLGLVSFVSSESGTLVVEAVSSGRYAPSVPLHVSSTVGSATGITPFNVTLNQGDYTVVYGPKEWYVTPPSKSVFVPGGKTVYAIASYLPMLRVISIDQSGPNSTAVTAMHSVTPVVWINNSGTVIVLEVDSFDSFPIQPSQNHTLVFPSSGKFNFYVLNTNLVGYVQSL